MYQTENPANLIKGERQALGSSRIWRSVGATVLLLGVTSLLTDISSEMVSVTLPIYLLASLQFSPFQVGIADGLYQGAAVLVRVISGFVSDRLSRPKQVASIGYAFSAFCKLGFLFGTSWSAISGLILLDRVGKGIRTAPRDAMIATSSHTDKIGTAFGVHRAMDTAGAMGGPLLAIAILSVAPHGYDAIFVVSFCIAIIGLSVITLFVRNPKTMDSGDEDRSLERSGQPAISLIAVRRLIGEPRFRTLVLVGSALALMTVSDGLLYLSLRQRMKISTNFFPLLYVITALAFMLFAIPAGRLSDRIGLKSVFLVGYGLLAGAYCILLFAHMNYVSALLLLTLLGGYYAATDGIFMALASGILPGHSLATGLALLTTGTGLARLMASTFYGLLWSKFGAELALEFYLGGLLSVLAGSAFMMRKIEVG